MMKKFLVIAVIALVSAPKMVCAQDVARLVSQVRDGEVRLSFTPRDGVCGDGADMIIADHKRYLYPGTTTYGDFPRSRMCIEGPVRVSIQRVNGRTTSIRTFAGGSWDRGSMTISQQSAMNFFLDVASSAPEPVAADAVMPGSIATLSGLIPRLRNLARDASRPEGVRFNALNWIGQVGGDESREILERIAYDDSMPAEVRSRALKGLWEMRAMDSLTQFAQSSEPQTLRAVATGWLEQKSHKKTK